MVETLQADNLGAFLHENILILTEQSLIIDLCGLVDDKQIRNTSAF